MIFAAFDKRHDGSVGSLNFISDYIIPHVLEKYKCSVQVKYICKFTLNANTIVNKSTGYLSFQGVLILESKLHLKFYKSNPPLTQNIMNEEGKGATVTIINRPGDDLVQKLKTIFFENGVRTKNLESPELNNQNIKKLGRNLIF